MTSFYLDHFWKDSLHIRAHSEVLGVQISKYAFKEDTIQPLMVNKNKRLVTKQRVGVTWEALVP